MYEQRCVQTDVPNVLILPVFFKTLSTLVPSSAAPLLTQNNRGEIKNDVALEIMVVEGLIFHNKP